MHVAITRARQSLRGPRRRRAASPFLAEMRGERHRWRRAGVTATALGKATARSRAKLASPLGTIPRPRRHQPPPRCAEWRKGRADADGVPAYVVLTNRQLEGIAVSMPADQRELLACDGIGPSRLEKYGDDIIALLDSVRG